MAGDPLSTTLSALADPTRRAILARLSLGEASVTELAEPFAMSLPAVSKHLKVLERAGVGAGAGAAKGGPGGRAPGPGRGGAGGREGSRRFWEASLDRLDQYLQTLQAGDPDVPES